MKKILFMLFGICFCIFEQGVCSGIGGQDYNYITFVNQTNHTVKFTVNIQDGWDRHDISKKLDPHTANYINVDQAEEHCTDGKGHKRKFEIKIKVDLPHRRDVHYTAHRYCGEDLYFWHQEGEYRINTEPHINADLSGCDKDETKPAVLFAHGFNDSQKAWAKFAKYIRENEREWRVFRTSVSEDGSIAKRAHMLAKYITKAADQCNIKDRQLRVVAHSMGGLDIRYIVSNPHDSKIMRDAAKKIERIYTIATPHQGQGAAGTIHTSDAAHDLGITQMENFNKKHPYRKFDKPLLALRFRCSDKDIYEHEDDGVVKTFRQVYPGAPYSKKKFTARHVESSYTHARCGDIDQELDLTDILEKILNDHREGGDNIPHRN